MYTSPFKLINKINKTERDKFTDNDMYNINYISNPSSAKKSYKPSFKKSLNISSRKMSNNSINNISRNSFQSKRNSSTVCSLKIDNIDKFVK